VVHRTSYQDSAGGLPPIALEVSYDQRQQSVPSSSRLLSLVKSAGTVLIVGVDLTFIVPDGSGRPMTAMLGGACMPGSLTQLVTVYLDTTDAAGQTYFVLDTNGNPTSMPLPVILYHELAHAFHYIQGDHTGEPQVQADENSFRAQLDLPLRHPTDPTGEVVIDVPPGPEFPRCKPQQEGWSPDCIVATAAVGSPHAPRVAALRRAKREYRSLSLWANLLAEPVLEAYDRFSPMVVVDMLAHPALRDAMLLYAVYPVFHMVHMVETYLGADADSPALMAELDRSMGQYVSELAAAGGPAPALTEAAEAAFLASRQVGTDRKPTSVDPSRLQMPRDLFSYLAAAITSSGDGTTGFACAFEGLGLFLRQAARFEEGMRIAPDFVRELGVWLARLPFPTDDQQSILDAREELRVLGERVFTHAHTRELFAKHLLARWPEPSVPALHSLLRDLGYIQTERADISE
jgi:hypothetical protein